MNEWQAGVWSRAKQRAHSADMVAVGWEYGTKLFTSMGLKNSRREISDCRSRAGVKRWEVPAGADSLFIRNRRDGFGVVRETAWETELDLGS